jgi:uncharacterized membrane protein YkvA (DUF1232 family)
MAAHPVRQSQQPWKAFFAALFALIYGASPIDLLPDILPLIGIVDDAIIIPLMLFWSVMLWRRHRRPLRTAAPAAQPIEIAQTYEDATHR